MPADCTHDGFAATVQVEKLVDERSGQLQNLIAEVSIRCASCGMPYHFIGVDTGLSFTRPTVNVPATTLHAPIAAGERTEIPDRIRYEMPT